MQQFRCMIPTNVWVRLAIVPALVFISMSIDRQYLKDFWHHLARGREIVKQGELLNQDIFTYTVAGESFRDVNWLTQVGYYHLYEIGGLELVQFANAAFLALTFSLVALFCWHKCGSLGVATAIGIFTFFGSWQVLTIRPQTFSLLLFVLVYWSLDQWEKRPWLLLVPPPLIGLWANLHGAFPAGIMLIGCFGLATAWKAWRNGNLWTNKKCWLLAACLVGSLLATMVNPYGWTIYQYVGLTSNRASLRGITEWLPPKTTLLIGKFWIVSLVMTATLYLLAWRIKKRLPTANEFCLALCFLPLACKSVRMVVWWLIIMAPILSILITTLLPKRQENQAKADQPNWGASVTFGIIILMAVLSVPWLNRWNPLLAFRGSPQHRLEDHLAQVHGKIAQKKDQGNIFTRFEWGEYMGWKASPKFKVFMDARIEIIPDNVWQEYIDLTCGNKNWQEILDKYQVEFLVLDPKYHKNNGLLPKVDSSPNWQRTYQIGNRVYLYERTDGVAMRED